MTLDTLWKIAVAIFLAGGMYAGFRQMKRDMNGIGARTRRDREVADFRFLAQVVAALVYQDDLQKREKLGKMYLEAGFPEGRR